MIYYNMIVITKAEMEVIAERFPNVHIVRTMKQKSNRHRYYCEESKGVIRILDVLRGNTENEIKGGGRDTDGKKRK